ncbi:MAG: MFS transporter [Chloroflexi bacterium]|nr:MFS transporter [Chloroflexota bacterium]
MLPQLLRAAGSPDLITGLLSSTRGIEGSVTPPVLGALSDRTRGRLGRRRPFILVAVPLSAAFFLFASGASSLLSLAIAIFPFSVFFNVAYDPYVALLADIAPPRERALLSGISNAVQLVAQVAFLAVIALTATAGVPAWSYLAVSALMLLSSA